MASFLGSVATEMGGALKEHGQNVREERLLDEDAQRDMQLAKQRMGHESKLLQTRMDSDDKRAARRMEYETTAAQQQQTWDTEAAEAERTADEAKYKYEGSIDMATAAMNAWTQQQKSGVGRGNGWTTFTEQGFDNESGAITTEFYAQRDGITYRQMGDKYIEAGSQQQPAQFESVDVQREAENKLWSGDVTAQQFKDVFGYVPASYITGQVAQGSDLSSFLRQNKVDFRRDAPAPDSGDRKGDSGGGSDGGSGSTSSASKRLQKIAEREDRVPTLEETDQVTASYRRSLGHDKYPSGVKPGDMGSPYQGDFEGDTSEWGKTVTEGRGALSQAEAAGKLTQGGQLEQQGPPAPTAAPTATAAPEQQGPPAAAAELSDEDAAEVADGVLQQMYQQSGVAKGVVKGVKRIGEMSPATAPAYTSSGSQQ